MNRVWIRKLAVIEPDTRQFDCSASGLYSLAIALTRIVALFLTALFLQSSSSTLSIAYGCILLKAQKFLQQQTICHRARPGVHPTKKRREGHSQFPSEQPLPQTPKSTCRFLSSFVVVIQELRAPVWWVGEKARWRTMTKLAVASRTASIVGNTIEQLTRRLADSADQNVISECIRYTMRRRCGLLRRQ